MKTKKNIKRVLMSVAWTLLCVCPAVGAQPPLVQLATEPGAASSPRCDQDVSEQALATCLLGNAFRLRNEATLDASRISLYRASASTALAKIKSMKALPPEQVQEAIFTSTWAKDPDNPAAGIQADASPPNSADEVSEYKEVCRLVATADEQAQGGLSKARCAVARLRLAALNRKANPPNSVDGDMEAVIKLAKAASSREPDARLNDHAAAEAQWLAALGLGFAAAARADSDVNQATMLSREALTIASPVQGSTAVDHNALAFAVALAEFIGVSVPIGEDPPPQTIDLLRNSYRIATENFPKEHPVVVNVEETLATADAGIAKRSRYVPSARQAAAKEAYGIATALYQSALSQPDSALQATRLKRVQQIFEELDKDDLVLEVVTRRYVLALQDSSSPSRSLQTAADIAGKLSQSPRYAEEAEVMGSKLLPKVQASPDDAPGIGIAIYNVVDALTPVLKKMAPCEQRSRLLLLRSLNTRGKTIADKDPLRAGMLSPPFDAQLILLQMYTKDLLEGPQANALAQCGASPPIPTAEDDLSRETEQLIKESSHASDAYTLQLVQHLFDRIEIRADEVSSHTPFVAPQTASLDVMASRVFAAGNSIADRGKLTTSLAWTNFVESETRRRYNSGDVTNAFALLTKHEDALSRADPPPYGAIAGTLRSYPQLFSRETTPRVWSPYIYENLIRARVGMGDFSGARDLLSNLPKDYVEQSRSEILDALAKGTPTLNDMAWVKTLSPAEISSWQTNRWQEELRNMPVGNIASWLAQKGSANRTRRSLAVEKLIEAGQYDEAISIATAGDDVDLRSHAAFMLVNVSAASQAEKLENRGISAPASAAVQIALSQKSPSDELARLRRAAQALERAPEASERAGIAGDILCAATGESSKAFARNAASQYVSLISKETNALRADRSRRSIGYCLSKLGMFQESFALLEQIGDSGARISAFEEVALALSKEWGDPVHAEEALRRAQRNFSSLPPIRQATIASQFFETMARISGLDKTVAITDGLISERSANEQTAMLREHAIYENALQGLANAALKNEGSGVVAILLDTKRSIVGDSVTGRIAISTLELAASRSRNEHIQADPVPLIQMITKIGFHEGSGIQMVPFLSAIAELGQFDEAMRLISNFAQANARSYAYAYFAHHAALSSASRSRAEALAKMALSDAQKTPWREERIDALAHVAALSSVMPGLAVSQTAADLAMREMNRRTVEDEHIAASFAKLKAISKETASGRDADEIVRAFAKFGEYYKEQGYDESAREAVKALTPYMETASVAAYAKAGIREAGDGTPTEKYVQPMLDDWKRRAPRHPEAVLQEIESDMSDYRDDSLPIGIEAYQLGFALSRQQLARLDRQATLSSSSSPDGAPVASQHIADKLLALLAQRQKSVADNDGNVSSQAFEVMASAQQSAAATALLRAMARQKLGVSGGAAQMADVAAQNWGNARERMIASLSETQDPTQLSTALKDTVTSRSQFANNEAAAIDRTKLYLALVHDTAAQLPRVTTLLKNDEALLLYRVTDDIVALCVVTTDGIHYLDLRSDGRVDAKRIAQWVSSIRNSVNRFKDNGDAPYDYDAAYQLYKAAVGPAVPYLASRKHLIVIPDGALAAIPFQSLLTSPLAAGTHNMDELRAVPWLTRKYSVAVAPSVSSFLLAPVAGPLPDKPFIAIGDPVLWNWLPHRCNGARAIAGPPEKSLAVSEHSGALVAVSAKSSASNVKALGDAIPDTGCLLRELARYFSASEDDILVGPMATERAVKQLSANGSLSNYRVVAFATHGLMSGQPGVNEPGLVLTPPVEPTPIDDGYLTASEIVTLSLNADLVLLSACNSAVGAGRDGAGEAFGGLASAFLFAGARHLYVSHWAIDSTAASRIFSRSFKEAGSHARSGRDYAVALQNAELDLLRGATTPREANPSYWAPISEIGP